MLKILQARLQQYLNQDLPDEWDLSSPTKVWTRGSYIESMKS